MTIKEIAGKVLLYLYEIQREQPAKLLFIVIEFDELPGGRFSLNCSENKIKTALLKISENPNDIYNAHRYLVDKNFIQSSEQAMAGSGAYIGCLLTDHGVDIIESIERGNEEKARFNLTFNIKVENNMNVESLIKANLSALGLHL